MARQRDATVRRLRRLGRMLCNEVESADALVLETLSSTETEGADIPALFSAMIERNRAVASPAPRESRLSVFPVRSEGDIGSAFAILPLVDREVLALAVVERLSHDTAARILGLPTAAFAGRLAQARAALGRVVDGERRAGLRLVK